ncbi:MAG: Gfo/Idh/MocA family oxidoreductase [Clostridia bacterium]|nr:Gfo/Idh/MocA family oxidoreductase [Clostridia bacterium]
MQKLKVAVVGCGKIASLRHAPEYSSNPGCEIIGFYDVDTARAKSLADHFGGQAFASFSDLIASQADAVSVCTANIHHAQNTLKLLKAGKHVLCEKPMAVTSEECEEMVLTAEKSGKRLLIGLNQRFSAAHTLAREMIVRGDIGKVLSFHTCFAHPGPEIWTGMNNTWFFDKHIAAFGAMADLGVHKVDLIHYLLGEHISTVTASLRTIDKRLPTGELISVDDNGLCILETPSGVIGQLHVSWTNYGQEDNSTFIYGTEGVIKLYADPDHSLIIEKKDGTVVKENPDHQLTNEDQLAGKLQNTGVIDEFVSAILDNRPSRLDACESIHAMRVLFAAAKSSESGKRIHIYEE